MENIFVTAAIISVMYFTFKFIVMRFVEKENKPLKVLVSDSLLVYFSVILGYFVIEQVNPVIQNVSDKNIHVFTDNPGF
jgi:predicted PurR-regulated permease PerM